MKDSSTIAETLFTTHLPQALTNVVFHRVSQTAMGLSAGMEDALQDLMPAASAGKVLHV